MKKIKFMDLELFVPKDVFTPRPETELVVNVVLYALWAMKDKVSEPRILDIGTGSGNIAISLTKFNPACKLVTLELIPEAIEIARTNAYLNGVSGRIEFIQSNLFENIGDKFPGKFDIIVSNPPYVPQWEMPTLAKEVQNEPRAALDGGEDGLNFYRKISEAAPRYLKRRGSLVMEMGYNQSNYVAKLLEKRGVFSDFETFKDDAGIDRVIKVRYG